MARDTSVRLHNDQHGAHSVLAAGWGEPVYIPAREREDFALRACPESLRTARRAANAWACERRLPEPLIEDVALVVNELASNAVAAMVQRHTSGVTTYPYGATFRVTLALLSFWPMIQVWDPNPTIPTIPAVDQDGPERLLSESGRGLQIVQDLSALLVFLPNRVRGGKAALALLPV